MIPTTSRYQVSRSEGAIYVRPEGLANMKTAPLLHAFLVQAIADGARQVCVDLSVCTGMDSTFMGLLVGKSHTLAEHGGSLAVVKPNETCRKLLHMLGIDQVVPVLDDLVPPSIEFVVLEGDPGIDQGKRTELVRNAHLALVNLNEANKAKFGPFLAALEADLAKRKH